METFDELVVGYFRAAIDDGVEEAETEHFPDVTAAGLIGGGIFAIGFHASEGIGENGAGPGEIEFLGGGLWLGQFVGQIIERDGRVPGFRGAKAIKDEIAEAGFEEITEAAAVLISLGEPALLQDFVLREILEYGICLVLEAGERGHKMDFQWLPIATDELVEGDGLSLRGAAEFDPVGARKN